VFSLDDLILKGSGNACYVSGSRVDGTSVTSASYGAVLDHGFDRFTAPLFGGHNGLDITEKEPFRNSALSSKTELTHYAYASIQRAIDTVADPEYVEMNMASIPGITESTLTNMLMNMCEDRGDTLAIIDPEGGYTPSTENTSSKTTNRGSAETVVSNMKTRKPNSSYAAAYYPWVQINDPNTNQLVWMPPSVVMMGAIANAEKVTGAPWFAPAGFNRGGLSEGMGGFPVVNVTERLTKKQRDELYEINVNPIAKFPREGIVVFGQKTLQLRPSALDRVNVRRMMIYIKKAISRVAASVLFDQNVATTWTRFKESCRPILTDAKARFGIVDYKLVLDETTTTPDLIDQNALYAKIAIKPAKAIEYIFIDFNITNSGASFDD
jgi:phage tail sheath protein FI